MLRPLVLGAHMPTSGGLSRALERGRSLGCDAVQIFTRNQLQWKAAPLTEPEVAAFRALLPGLVAVISHGSYLLNLASPEEEAFERSWRALGEELRRSDALGLPAVVVHPGAHRGSGESAAVRRVAEAIARADDAAAHPRVRILLETTAGQGTVIGKSFEELRDMLGAARARPGGLGVCLDSCHLFAAGYDLRGAEAYGRTMRRLEEVLGFAAVGAVHLNDCAGELGSHADRHQHIGKGRIGKEGFRLLVTDPRLRGIPLCLETPKGEDLAEDAMNLRLLRRLAAGTCGSGGRPIPSAASGRKGEAAMAKTLTDKQVNERAEKTRAKRMAWWHDARFGMFVHWGLYSQLGRHEWVMNRERIPIAEYEKLAATWKPKERPMREWARLAVDAGMKYMVMTTKHHEGFCLWDTEQTDYNAVKRGPGRDLVREYVEACREAGLRVGFYYSLMDWHHPDGARCAKDEKARRRFLDFTQGCVRELMSNYGKIDILWYDVSWPLKSPKLWESATMNAMARRLQPDIIINNRSQLAEDFGTPEEHIQAADPGRAWEACMTFNGSWGYFPTAPDGDWHSTRSVIGMLRQVTAGGGNLLLNIGPAPDGSVPPLAYDRLIPVGNWLRANGEAVYGKVDRVQGQLEGWLNHGAWTLKGNVAYYWTGRWVGSEIAIGGLKTRVKRITILGSEAEVAFEQGKDRLVMRGLPSHNPDPVASYAVLRLEFEKKPRQALGTGCVLL